VYGLAGKSRFAPTGPTSKDFVGLGLQPQIEMYSVVEDLCAFPIENDELDANPKFNKLI